MLVVEKTTEILQFGAAELLKFNTSKPGDEQVSLKEYVDRTKERSDLGDEDEKKTLEELNTEFEPLAELTEGVLGDKGEKVIVSDKIVDSPCVLTTSEYGWSAKMERIMEAQALRDNSMTSHMVSKRKPWRSIQQRGSGSTNSSSNNSARAASINPPRNQQDKREGEKGRRKKGTRKGERRKKRKLKMEVNRSRRT